MQNKLIKLEDCNIIVSDEDIKKGDFIYQRLLTKNILKSVYDSPNTTAKKIIASDNPEHNLPSIDWNGLEEKYGVVDVEKLARKYSMDQYIDYGDLNDTAEIQISDSFINGFNKAQSLNDKRFNLEDLIQAIELRNEFLEEDMSNEQIIQSLQEPEVFDIEVETHGIFPEPYTPKITNNKIKILK